MAQLPKEFNHDDYLIATDTALSFLLKNGITPDIVTGIDSRNISYLNYIGVDCNCQFIFDIGYPHIITRRIHNKIFVTSNFPFVRFFNGKETLIPNYDASAGNVGAFCLNLAALLQPKAIHTFGMDFSYPHGDLYAKETYFYEHFLNNESRLHTYFSGTYSFLTRYSLQYDKVSKYYTTPLLNTYKSRTYAQIKENGYTSSDNRIFLPVANNTKHTKRLNIKNMPLNINLLDTYINSCLSIPDKIISSDIHQLSSSDINLIQTLTPLLVLHSDLPLQERVNKSIEIVKRIISQ